MHLLIIIRLFPSNSALQNGRTCLAEAMIHIFFHIMVWKHENVHWVRAILVLQPYLCLAMGPVLSPTPTLTCLALAPPCPHSHGGAQRHWADAESTCLGNAIAWGESLEQGFSLPMRLIYNIYYIFFFYIFKCQVPGQGLHFRSFLKALLFPTGHWHGLLLWAPFPSLLNQP